VTLKLWTDITIFSKRWPGREIKRLQLGEILGGRWRGTQEARRVCFQLTKVQVRMNQVGRHRTAQEPSHVDESQRRESIDRWEKGLVLAEWNQYV
jgi:hypothetical protein